MFPDTSTPRKDIVVYFLNKKMISVSEQKELQRKFSDKVFKSYFKNGQGPYVDSLIGDFIDYYTIKKAISLLPFKMKGMKVLSVCSGDGPEGEYLYRKGARVMITDISSEAIKAAKRRCPQLRGRVADAEKLPFEDNSFDLVLVRHGLHHLANPYKGIYEMNRVGKRGFVFIEAQKNFITKILIKLGLAEEYEASGNYVYRFTRAEIKKLMKKLKISNYRISTSWCYHFDYLTEHVYPHFDNKTSYLIFTTLFYIFNFFFGYFGNSLTVIALRD